MTAHQPSLIRFDGFLPYEYEVFMPDGRTVVKMQSEYKLEEGKPFMHRRKCYPITQITKVGNVHLVKVGWPKN